MSGQSLINVISDAQDVLNLEPEDLAAALLQWWNRSGVIATNLLEDAFAPQFVVRFNGRVPAVAALYKHWSPDTPRNYTTAWNVRFLKLVSGGSGSIVGMRCTGG